MKNIHVLPTDKPSRFVTSKYKKKCYLYSIEEFKDIDKFREYDSKSWDSQNICITSNEEDINENDYIITRDGRLVQVSYLLSKDLEGASKVILTTNQDLIKDGVQAIDDEFLEWFVKNPSCESVEVDKEEDELISPKNPKIRFNYLQDPPSFISAESLNNMILTYKYKIIIPQEEPKQETLEEVAERYYEDEVSINAFINGAKWQQEQILDFLYEEITERRDYSASKMCEKVIEFIEQFKKK